MFLRRRDYFLMACFVFLFIGLMLKALVGPAQSLTRSAELITLAVDEPDAQDSAGTP